MTKIIGRSALWIFSFLLVVLSVRSLFLGIEIGNPEMIYHLDERKAVLYFHMGSSSVALFLVPFQFWKGLRLRLSKIHRIAGRTCAVAILFGGVSGVFVGLGTAERYGVLAAAGFALSSALWVLAAIIAVRFAIVRNIAAHRTWMIITVALILGAVSFRFENLIFRHALGLSYNQASALAAWTCWMFNVAVVAYWHRAALLAGRIRFA